MSFVERHGLWAPAQSEAMTAVKDTVTAEKLETIRLSFADQHGVLRGKTLMADEALKAFAGGCMITTTMILKDTAHRTVFPVFTAGGGLGMREMQGGADIVMVADPTTFKVLPWADKSGWVLCDLYFQDGRPVPFSSRQILRAALDKLAARGQGFVAGLEVEFHLFKLDDPHMAPADATQPGQAPEVSLISKGYQYLTEQRYDQMEPALDHIRRAVQKLGLPLRSVEVEFGPSQCEFTFKPTVGLAPADTMVLFRSAVKQVAARNGYHATFMCRPKLANTFASGWHLHQSLRDEASGANVFMPEAGGGTLSPLGRGYLAVFAGRSDDGRADLEDARVTAEAVGDEIALGRALTGIGFGQMFPDPIASRATSQRARDIARRCGDDWAYVVATINLADSYVFRQEFDEAEGLLDEVQSRSEALGDLRIVAEAAARFLEQHSARVFVFHFLSEAIELEPKAA